MLTIRRYVQPATLEEAYTLNQKKGNRIIGGMLWLKMSKGKINQAIDLSLLGLDQIEETQDAFSIGAMVTLRQLEQHEGFLRYTNGIFEKAVKHIVGVQFRNMATIGGSLWGRFGFSDVLTSLIVMDTEVELVGKGKISLEEFSKMGYERDVISRIWIRKTPAKFAYTSVLAQASDLPVLNCGMALIDGKLRTAIGARPGRAMLFSQAFAAGEEENAFLRDKKKIEDFAENMEKMTPTMKNLRGSKEYRSHLVRVLTERCLQEIVSSFGECDRK